MRLPLAGQSYSNRVKAAAAQQTLNFFQETIQDPDGSGKSQKILVGTPGAHLIANLNAHAGNVRGFFSGGGRCFVVVGLYLYEILEGGAIAVGYPHLLPTSNNGLPVQMFVSGSGNQLGIVADGFFMVDDGTGIRLAQFQQSGVVTVAGAVVTWESGDKFPVGGPHAMAIGGRSVVITTYDTATQVTLSVPYPGSFAGHVTTFFNQVYWTSGDAFTSEMEGLPITIGGVAYTVKQVLSIGVLMLADADDAGQQVNVAYAIYQTNLPYSAASGDAVTAITGAYLDGQAYVQRPASPFSPPDLGRTVNFSAVEDFTSWSGLDFFQKEAGPDYIQSIMADREQLYVFGTQSDSEVWQNDINTGRPVRVPGAVAQEGSANRHGPVSMQEHVYFLGQSPGGGTVAYRVDGYTPTRISTYAVEQQWAASGAFMEDAVCWWYLEGGHYFYVICFGSGSTWVYDATEKAWHERAYWDGAAFAAYRFWFHTFIPEWGTNGQHIVGDHSSGKVFVMSSAFGDEEGADMKRVRALPYLFSAGKRVFVGRMQLTQAAGPTVALEWSSDDGATFTAPETGSGTGATVYWLAQGSFEGSAIPRLSVTGQLVTTLIDLDGEVEYGTT